MIRFSVSGDIKCVEPRKRMVGGRFGWAVHRFPIKGGISLFESMGRDWSESLNAQINRESFFLRLMRSK